MVAYCRALGSWLLVKPRMATHALPSRCIASPASGYERPIAIERICDQDGVQDRAKLRDGPGAPACAWEGDLTPAELNERMLQRRAVEAVIWGMPAVNTDLMFQAMARGVRGDWNQIVSWYRLGIGKCA